MGWTHHAALAIGTSATGPQNLIVTGSAQVTGTAKVSGQLTATCAGKTHKLTRLQVTGSLSATAAGKQTSLTKLAVSGTAVLSGILTATAAGKQTTLTKLNVSGTTRQLGLFVHTIGANFKMGSGANSVCGIKNILSASAGSGVVATTKVLWSSRILLTPMGQAYTGSRGSMTPWVATIATDVSFKIKLSRVQTTGTVVTAAGRVAWQIINK